MAASGREAFPELEAVMRDLLSGILVVAFFLLVLMPEQIGQSARTRYDLFITGWENPDAPRRLD